MSCDSPSLLCRMVSQKSRARGPLPGAADTDDAKASAVMAPKKDLLLTMLSPRATLATGYSPSISVVLQRDYTASLRTRIAGHEADGCLVAGAAFQQRRRPRRSGWRTEAVALQ